jgi:zinc protease
MASEATFAERVSLCRLSSGASLAVLVNPHAPTVTIAGTLRAGPAYTAGRFAVAGLAAAMLDRGTADHDRIELAGELENRGLQLAVRASAATPTIVSFSAQGLAEELPRLVALLMEVLRRPTFPSDELDKLREQVLGSLVRERQETHERAFAALSRALFPEGHPLRRREIEEREQELVSLTRDELAAFHEEVYGPAKMVLAVVGHVDPSTAASLFEEQMRDWPDPKIEDPAWPENEEPEPVEERIQIADRPSLDVFLGHRGRLLRGSKEYPAAVLANSCLGQSTLTSRLGKVVRDEHGLTYGIYSRFFGTLCVAGPWATSVGVSADNLDRAVALSRQVISDFVEDGPAEEELADERSALAGAYRVGLATNSGVARELVTALTAGEGVDRLDRFPEDVLAVTRAHVMAAIREYLHPDRLVLTAAGDFQGDVQR